MSFIAYLNRRNGIVFVIYLTRLEVTLGGLCIFQEEFRRLLRRGRGAALTPYFGIFGVCRRLRLPQLPPWVQLYSRTYFEFYMQPKEMKKAKKSKARIIWRRIK